MIRFAFILFFISCSFNEAISQAYCQWDTMYRSEYNPTTTTFDLKNRDIAQYNSSGYLIDRITQNYDPLTSSWINSSRAQFTYTPFGEISEYIRSNYIQSTNAWRNVSRSSNTYSTSNKLLTFYRDAWDTLSSSWKNESRTVYSYTSFDSLSGVNTFQWDPIANFWRTLMIQGYTYDANNFTQSYGLTSYNLNTGLVSYKDSFFSINYPFGKEQERVGFVFNYSTSMLEPSIKYNDFYDANLNLTKEEIKSWNSTTNTWYTFGIETNYQYDGLNRVISNEFKRGESYLPSSRSVYRYLTHYRSNTLLKDTILLQRFDTLTNSWFDSLQTVNIYNASNKVAQSKSFAWKTTLPFWQQRKNVDYTYTSGFDKAIYELEIVYNTDSGRMVNSKQTFRNQSLVGSIKEIETQTDTWMLSNGLWGNSSYNLIKLNANDSIFYSIRLDNLFTPAIDTWQEGSLWEYSCLGSMVGISDLENVGFSIYPNPFSNTFTIFADKSESMEISDIHGRIVYKKSITSGENLINTDNLGSGIFLIKLGNSVQKLIKQ